MYLARYTLDEGPSVQAAAHLTYPRSLSDRTPIWWERFRALLRILDTIPEASASLRVRLEDDLRVTFFEIGRAHV